MDKEMETLERKQQDETPHVVLKADCLRCGCHWVAVIPVGAQPAECPTCGKHSDIKTEPAQK